MTALRSAEGITLPAHEVSMSQVDSSHDDQHSGRTDLHDPQVEQNTTSSETRSELWRVIAADGSSQEAPGQLDEATVARILANKPRRAPSTRAAHFTPEPGDEIEPLSDFLNDEDVTLLDLDLLSCDLSLLSVEVVPVDHVPPSSMTDATHDTESIATDDEIAKLSLPAATSTSSADDRQLSAVIRAWPRLPNDLRDAIWWIARGGMRRTPHAR